MAQKKRRSNTTKRKTKKQLQQQEKLTVIGLGFLFFYSHYLDSCI